MTDAKIEGFGTKQSGWHYGEGVAFERTTLDSAIGLHQKVLRQGSFQTNAFPGLNGEVLVTVYEGSRYWEFYVEPNGTFTFVYEIDDEEIDRREKLTLQEIGVIISQLRVESVGTAKGREYESDRGADNRDF